MHRPVGIPTVLALSCTLVLSVAGTSLADDEVVMEDAEGNPVTIADSSRVATLGGVITETAYALGAEDVIVAVDDSSYYPLEALVEKTAVGYYRMLAAEPVLATDAELIIGSEETGPPEVLAQLRDAGVTMLLLPDPDDADGAKDLIERMGQALDRPEAAAALIEELEASVSAASALTAEVTSAPRVLFILRPPGAPTLVAGSETAAGRMIELAGGANVYPGFPGYIPMTPEGIVETGPDVILTTDGSLREYGGYEAFMAEPGIELTPAADEGRIYSMEDLYLLGFGPRTGDAVADLARLLHPELAAE